MAEMCHSSAISTCDPFQYKMGNFIFILTTHQNEKCYILEIFPESCNFGSQTSVLAIIYLLGFTSLEGSVPCF